MAKDSIWILVLLLVLFLQPLRDAFWNVLNSADPLVLILALIVVWKLGSNSR